MKDVFKKVIALRRKIKKLEEENCSLKRRITFREAADAHSRAVDDSIAHQERLRRGITYDPSEFRW